MRWFLLFTLFATLVASPDLVAAQSSQEAQIQSRLDEIKNMIDEETRTIGVLEGQLKRAIQQEQDAQVERIRLEIEQAWMRVETLKGLDQRLKELMETASSLGKELEMELRPQPQPGNARRRDIPRPRIAGLETREDIEKLKRELMEEREAEPADEADSPGQPAAGLAMPAADAPPAPPAPPASTRLRNLERSLQALKDAGEFDIARQVEQLIRREQERLASQRDQNTDDNPDQNTGQNPDQNDAPGLRRPAAADQPRAAAPRQPRPPRQAQRTENEALRVLVTEMRDEIRRLREAVNELKNAQGDDQNDQ